MHYKITVPYNETNVIAPMGGMFWGRCEAFKLFLSKEFKFEDFPPEPLSKSDGLLTHILERVISILIQQSGYYIQRVCPDFYAQIYLNELYDRCRLNDLSTPAVEIYTFKNSFLENIFSLKNRYAPNTKHKVCTILGFKISKKVKK